MFHPSPSTSTYSPGAANGTPHQKEQSFLHPGFGVHCVAGDQRTLCTLTSLNCARVLLEMEEERDVYLRYIYRGGRLAGSLCDPNLMKRIMGVTQYLSKRAVIECEDLYKLPYFMQSLERITSRRGHIIQSDLRASLADVRHISRELKRSTCMVLTTDTTGIACFYIVYDDLRFGLFAFFIPRPSKHYPHGAGFIVSDSLRGIASHVEDYLLDSHSQAHYPTTFHPNPTFCSYVLSSKQHSSQPVQVDWQEASLQADLKIIKLRASRERHHRSDRNHTSRGKHNGACNSQEWSQQCHHGSDTRGGYHGPQFDLGSETTLCSQYLPSHLRHAPPPSRSSRYSENSGRSSRRSRASSISEMGVIPQINITSNHSPRRTSPTATPGFSTNSLSPNVASSINISLPSGTPLVQMQQLTNTQPPPPPPPGNRDPNQGPLHAPPIVSGQNSISSASFPGTRPPTNIPIQTQAGQSVTFAPLPAGRDMTRQDGSPSTSDARPALGEEEVIQIRASGLPTHSVHPTTNIVRTPRRRLFSLSTFVKAVCSI